MTRFLLVFVMAAGCVQSGKVTCADGRICPPGYTCDDTLGRCVSPEQQAACMGVAENGACEFSGAPGTCHAGYCDPLLCGDGVVAGSEVCDGSDLAGATCKTAGFYDEPGLACTAFCTYDTSACTGFCGDGIVNGPEQCDGMAPAGTCASEGFDAGPLECGPSCAESFAACARFGWRTEPLDGLAAEAIAGTGHSDQWVVGDGGRIAHYNGNNWVAVASPVADTLVDVASVSATDAWAVGIGAAVGDPGVVLHYTGTWNLTPAPTAQYTAVWAADANHVYFATRDREIQWWDGAAWQQLAGPGGALALIAGTSPTDLWVTTSNGSLWHYTGTWTASTLAGVFDDIVAVSPTNVWAIGNTLSFTPLIAHWDGSAWQTWLDVDRQPVASLGVAAATNDVWVSTTTGNVLHFDGTGWVIVHAALSNTPLFLLSFGPGEVVGVATTGFAYRYHGQAFGRGTTGSSTASVGIWSDRPDDIFALSNRAVHHYDGTNWTPSLTVAAGQNLTSIWGSGPSDVWTVGPAGLYQYTGAWTQPAAPPGALQQVWGTSAGDVWLFGAQGAFHGPGTWTQELAAPGATWTSVSGPAPNDVWAVRGNELWHWDGTVWVSEPIPSTNLVAVSARNASDVWVTAANAHALHWDGTAWTDSFVPAIADLTAIYALAPDDVVAASKFELIHFDGTAWSPIRLDLDTASNALAGLFVPARDRFELIFSNFPAQTRELIRTRPWNCRDHETDCADAIDDDCDGLIDHLDPDCP